MTESRITTHNTDTSISSKNLKRQSQLTANEFPTGFRHSAGFSAATSPDPRIEYVKLPQLDIPTHSPKGLHKLWRYARTFINLIRRPTVVKNLPIHLQLESTSACNLHCTTCSRDIIIKKSSMLEEAQWKKIIDEIRPSNINVSGIGEPFLHPQIFKIIKYAKSKGAAVNCATNFTRTKGRHREMVESGISQLKVSIDATDKETFRMIRGDDAFDGILENIREVVRWREKLNSDTPSVRFNFALQRFNYKQVVDLIDLAAELGVDGIYYQYLEYVDMEDRKQMLSFDMTRKSLWNILKKAEQRALAKGIVTNLNIWWRDFDVFWNKMQPIAEFIPNHKPCYFPWFSTWLGADGWVRPCPIMPWTLDEGRMGHIDEQSFSEIWNGSKYRTLRAALARGQRPTRSCKTCIPQSLQNILFLRFKLLPKK